MSDIKPKKSTRYITMTVDELMKIASKEFKDSFNDDELSRETSGSLGNNLPRRIRKRTKDKRNRINFEPFQSEKNQTQLDKLRGFDDSKLSNNPRSVDNLKNVYYQDNDMADFSEVNRDTAKPRSNFKAYVSANAFKDNQISQDQFNHLDSQDPDYVNNFEVTPDEEENAAKEYKDSTGDVDNGDSDPFTDYGLRNVQNGYSNNKPEPTSEEQDRDGIIRDVAGAYLVYKRVTPDGTYDELWIYNISPDLTITTKIKHAILAGTDIDSNTQYSNNDEEHASSYSLGNLQFLKLTGLPN